MKSLLMGAVLVFATLGCTTTGTQSAATLSAASLAKPVDPIDYPRYLLFYNTFAAARRGSTAMRVHELLPFKFSASEAGMVSVNFPKRSKMDCQGAFCTIAWQGEETSLSLSGEPRIEGFILTAIFKCALGYQRERVLRLLRHVR